jgi:hypothetical protein
MLEYFMRIRVLQFYAPMTRIAGQTAVCRGWFPIARSVPDLSRSRATTRRPVLYPSRVNLTFGSAATICNSLRQELVAIAQRTRSSARRLRAMRSRLAIDRWKSTASFVASPLQGLNAR